MSGLGWSNFVTNIYYWNDCL